MILDSVDWVIDVPTDAGEVWFRERSHVTTNPGQPEMFTPIGGGATQQFAVIRQFASDPKGGMLGHVLSWFLRVLDAGQRGALAASSMGQPGMQANGGPLHRLFVDGDRESELSEICERTFGFPLTLDRANGDVLLRVGKPGVESPPLQHPTLEYAQAVAALPKLGDQGDGVKNYIGMVLHLMTGVEQVTVIDEPEAFLHPAQARALGRHLGKQAKDNDRQLLTATHDRDFVLGLLDGGCPVTFVRLNRVADITSAVTLAPTDVEAIWAQPALRYSNVLQGLFHRAVAVCEADADCRWYAAVLDVMAEKAAMPGEEALFVPGGGKAQVPKSVRALRSLDVKAFAILDFDAVLDVDFVQTLLTAFDVVDPEMIKLATAVAKSITTAAQREQAKATGLKGLPPGNATKMASDLLSRLRDIGAIVIDVGELESFDRTLGNHGAPWVTAALDANKHKASPDSERLLAPLMDSLRPLAGAV